MRISSVVGALAVSAVLLLPMAGVASAQDRDCSDFGSRSEAQQALDAAPDDPDLLDGDGDGIACESYFGEPAATMVSDAAALTDADPIDADTTDSDPDTDTTDTDTTGADAAEVITTEVFAAAAVADRDCADFATPAEAQQALDAETGDPERLDGDGDGYACEDHFGEPAASTSPTTTATATTTTATTTTATTTTQPADPADGSGTQVSVVPVGGVETGDGTG